MTKFTLINHANQSTYIEDSRSDAEDRRENGIEDFDFDAEDLEIRQGAFESYDDALQADMEDAAEADGGTTPEVVDADDVESPDLPDRTLTDDPIEWLQKGDGELTTTIKGATVITKKGFRVLQHHYDISTGSDVVVGPEETGHEFCRVKAWAEMPDGRRAEAHASAHVDRGDDHFLLVSMADTRAKSRALSDVTGVGAVAIEEMSGVEE